MWEPDPHPGLWRAVWSYSKKRAVCDNHRPTLPGRSPLHQNIAVISVKHVIRTLIPLSRTSSSTLTAPSYSRTAFERHCQRHFDRKKHFNSSTEMCDPGLIRSNGYQSLDRFRDRVVTLKSVGALLKGLSDIELSPVSFRSTHRPRRFCVT